MHLCLCPCSYSQAPPIEILVAFDALLRATQHASSETKRFNVCVSVSVFSLGGAAVLWRVHAGVIRSLKRIAVLEEANRLAWLEVRPQAALDDTP